MKKTLLFLALILTMSSFMHVSCSSNIQEDALEQEQQSNHPQKTSMGNNDLQLDRISQENDLYIRVKDAALKYESSLSEPDYQAFLQTYSIYNQAIPVNSSSNEVIAEHARQIRRMYDDLGINHTARIKQQAENNLFNVETRYYSEVEKAANLFIQSPNAQNYNSYISSYNNYLHYRPNIQEISTPEIRIRITDHWNAIENMNQSVSIICDVINKLDEAFNSFQNRPSSESLTYFIQRANTCLEFRIDNAQTAYAQSIISWMNGQSVLVELQGFDYTNSGFESSWGADVDFKATVSSGSSKIVFDVEDLSGDNKNSPSISTLSSKLGANIHQNMRIGIQDTVVVEFTNYNFRNDIGNSSVPFTEILRNAMNNGDYSHTFYSKSARRPDKGAGSVTIKFSNLPKYNR